MRRHSRVNRPAAVREQQWARAVPKPRDRRDELALLAAERNKQAMPASTRSAREQRTKRPKQPNRAAKESTPALLEAAQPAANEASFVGRAGFRVPGRKCIRRPCRLLQASARRAAAQQTNNTTMHKREPKPIAGRRHQRGRQQQRRRDRPRLKRLTTDTRQGGRCTRLPQVVGERLRDVLLRRQQREAFERRCARGALLQPPYL